MKTASLLQTSRYCKSIKDLLPSFFSIRSVIFYFIIASILSCSQVKKTELPKWKEPQWTKDVAKQLDKKNQVKLKQVTQIPKSEKTKVSQSPFWQQTVSTKFNQAPLNSIIEGLSQVHNFSFSLNASSNKKISYISKNIPLIDVLRDIAEKSQTVIQVNNKTLKITDDKSYWHNYQVNYPNILRQSSSRVELSQNVKSEVNSNGSGIEINSKVTNDFWKKLTLLIKRLEKSQGIETIIFSETGLVSIYGNHKDHQQIESLINQVIKQASMQAFIEIAIIEVELSDEYEAGIDWSIFEGDNLIEQQSLGSNIGSAPRGLITASGLFEGVNLNFGAKLVQRFGESKVISSPQLRLLNNQTTALKVVDNLVYFNFDSKVVQTDSANSISFNTIAKSVSVGLVVSVTPFIAQDNSLIINIKPSISKVYTYVNDPHPDLAKNNVQSRIPIIRERELESILKIKSGEVAIIGGLMQNTSVNEANKIPGLDDLLGYESKNKVNSELVLFLRARVL